MADDLQSTTQNDVIEAAVNELLAMFDVPTPPVPVEIMLQRPRGMWKEVNLAELSTTFIDIRQRYGPRMSVARLVARYASNSEWGAALNLGSLSKSDDGVRAFARAILMPRVMLESMPISSRNPAAVGQRFEVPDDDARQRLVDLGLMMANSD